MNRLPRFAVTLLAFALAGTAAYVGLLITRLEVEWVLAVVLGAMALGLVFVDYRIGVICLTIALPWSWSPLLPQKSGFNIINFLVFASLASLVLRRVAGKGKTVWFPHEMWWAYLAPIALAVFVAWPYLPIGEMNFPPRVDILAESSYAPVPFLKTKVIKPLFFVVYAFILMNAVRDSKKPERFLLALGLSALLPAVAIIVEVLSGVDVNDRKHFLADLGLQVNEYGTLLAFAAGPLLFIAAGKGPLTVRAAAAVAFAVSTVAMVMTASRGAVLALAVVVAVFLLRRRKLSDMLMAISLAAVMVVIAPDAVIDRLVMGFDDLGSTGVHNSDDPLTKGRIALWAALAPEFSGSPLWGHGLASTGWNSAVTTGRVHMGHPHNLYLAILLDLGLLGGLAMLYLYYRIARSLHRLSDESLLSATMRDFFAGAFAAYLGFLCASVTGGSYTPHPEQTFLWFSLGLCFAYWQQALAPRIAPMRKPFGFGVRSVAARRSHALEQR